MLQNILEIIILFFCWAIIFVYPLLCIGDKLIIFTAGITFNEFSLFFFCTLEKFFFLNFKWPNKLSKTSRK